MKRFGLWLSILVLICGGVGMMFASKLIMIRNSWSQKITKANETLVTKRKEAADLERQLILAKTALNSAVFDWERYWSTVGVDRGRQAGTIGVNIGSTQGLVAGSVVYVFQPSADGTGTSYVGPFKVSVAQEAQAALTPFWRTREGEDAGWRYGANWRIRSNIPRQHKTKFTDLEAMLLRKDELFVAQQKHLLIQQEAKKSAEEHLALRQKELSGDAELAAKQENLEPYIVEGYQKAVAELEVARDEVQAIVDELRRQTKRTRDRINQLTTGNEQRAKQLEEPPKTALKP
jgi:hypothetical protein